MSGGQGAWVFLLVLGIFLMIIGFQGNLGCTIAIFFSPQDVLTGTAVPQAPPVPIT